MKAAGARKGECGTMVRATYCDVMQIHSTHNYNKIYNKITQIKF